MRFALVSMLFLASVTFAQQKLLNVSYDPTRELYVDYNKAFIADYKARTGQDVTVDQSHGGSGAQARKVADGLEADVVTLALGFDIDSLVESKLLPADWQQRLPDRSTPFNSTIVFLVRKGNPKQIKDWGDLVRSGVEVVTPNPKTSGGARWNYLAAYGWALRQNQDDAAKARAFVGSVFRNVKVLDSGARGSLATFVQRNQGDVLIAWENEALMIAHSRNGGRFEVVYPSLSILAEPPVAVVDRNVDKNKTRALAEAYVKFAYTPAAQEIAARHYYRPTEPATVKKFAEQFKTIELLALTDIHPGGWAEAQKVHFATGGVFDQIRGEK